MSLREAAEMGAETDRPKRLVLTDNAAFASRYGRETDTVIVSFDSQTTFELDQLGCANVTDASRYLAPAPTYDDLYRQYYRKFREQLGPDTSSVEACRLFDFFAPRLLDSFVLVYVVEELLSAIFTEQKIAAVEISLESEELSLLCNSISGRLL